MRPPVHELTAHAVVRETVVFRVVRGASAQDPEVLEGLRSNYQRGFDPRGIEVANALVHMGLSTSRAQQKAVGMHNGGRVSAITLQNCDYARNTASGSRTRANQATSRSGDARCSCSTASPICFP